MDARYSAKTAFFIPVCFATEVVPGKAGKEADACKRNRKNPRKFLRDEYTPPPRLTSLHLPASHFGYYFSNIKNSPRQQQQRFFPACCSDKEASAVKMRGGGVF